MSKDDSEHGERRTSDSEPLYLSGLEQFVLNFAGQCDRIVEEVAVDGNMATRRITFTVVLPGGSFDSRFARRLGDAERYVIPIVLLPRGQSVAPIRVKTSAGELLSPLAPIEGKKRLARVVQGAVEDRLIHLGIVEQREQCRKVAEYARRVVTRPSSEALDVVNSIYASEKLDERIDDSFTDDDMRMIEVLRTDADARIKNLLGLLARFYYVMVDYVGYAGDRVMLTCTYSRPLIERDHRALRRDSIRRLVGADSYRFRFPLALAYRTKSYHFTMLGPERHFVREQSVRNITASPLEGGNDSTSQLTPIRPLKPEGRHVGRPSSAGRRAHLYLEGPSRKELGKIYARIVFYEQAPGQQGAAAIIAAAQATVLTVVMLVLGSLVQRQVNFDVPAFFLAAPGVASVVAYPRSSAQGVYQTPIRARLVLLGSALIAVLSSLSYVCLAAWRVTQPSWVSYAAWTAFIAIDLVGALWCLVGARFNQSCFEEAILYRQDRSDFFDLVDYNKLVDWDSAKGGS